MINDKSHWEIPSSIDVEGFLTKYPPEFKYKIDHFYFIVEYLAKGMEHGDLDQNLGFINTSSVILQKRIKNYKQYLDHMLEHGFIRTDMEYIPGYKSKGYLISGRNKEDMTINFIPIQDAVSKRNRIKDNAKTIAKNKKTEKNYPYLTKWFNEKLEIDSQKAKLKLNELFPVETGGIRGPKIGTPSSHTKKVKAIYSISKLENLNFYYSVDDNVGRFHSNLTNIKKELRNYITYDSKKLVNVDIKNSQPFFSTLLFNTAFYEEKSENFNMYKMPSLSKVIGEESEYISLIIMLGKTLESTMNTSFSEYLDMVNSADFYNTIHTKLYPEQPFDRPKVKLMILIYFFSKNRSKSQFKKDFKNALPEVHKLFALIKRKNHKALSHILQRIESEIIIERVTKLISIEKPELPIFTIHDSVVTTQGNENYVSDVIKDEIKLATGLDVKLGLEYWNPGD
ncbi:hypothetical protein [Aestuariibaculum lutulentum]|uniref:DNA-directed DNA polymerase family A palm domain-containing protein n=1 Tax=Aestuariibaculum lutulentum TaxID=2920935 RepID=A0ABS9RGD3_9FLAO|nr:hypothetical protein [Aestuariibaculum lutulentum]MCH4551999.1 hypothetical protein [Aestuariibaculum lutulentum]